MKTIGSMTPVVSTHTRALELATEYLKLSQDKREKMETSHLESVSETVTPVEMQFKAAIAKLKV